MPHSKYKQGADGRWRTSIRTGEYDKQGRPITVRLSSTKSSADLERQVREVKYKMDHGRVYVSQTVTLGEYAPIWLETKTSRSRATYQEYEYFIKNHLKSLETLRLDYIRPSDIQRHINLYSETPSMCRKILLVLNQIFDMAVNEDLIPKNPCVKINLPRIKKDEKRVLTPQECIRVKNAEDLDERERALLHLFYGSGLRPAEIYALQWRDIDFKANTVSVNKALQFGRTGKTSVGLPKTDKSIRTIPVPSFVIGSLLAYRDSVRHLPTSYLFGREGALYLNRTGYDNQLKRILKTLELSDITPYSFRHNYCTMCYNQKIDLKTVQFLMGHSDTKMILSVYAHLDRQNNVISAAVNSINF